tara:strand:+ start:392 stop:1018 length:627 start_codon:yes stop_codon:yes gene_type:complete
MGFLNNTTVTVDAILTKKGRELLAQGTEAFNITKFALADDEVDYGLWDVTHPNGSDSYGAVIENMPLLEAIPDENHVMRYKLVSLQRNIQRMAVITVAQESTGITFGALQSSHSPHDVIPETSNIEDSTYTFILHDQSVCSMTGGDAVGNPNFSLNADEAANSLTRRGTQVRIEAGTGVDTAKSTQLVIVGDDTGATTSVTITNNFVV